MTAPSPARSARHRLAFVWHAVFFACAAIAPQAGAQPLPASPTASSAGLPMTRDELRACLDEEDRLAGERRRQDAAHATLSTQAAEVDAEARALSAEKAAIDTRDHARVDAYNARSIAYESRAAALNVRLAAFNDGVDRLNALAADHLARCVSRSYDPADRDAVQSERAARPATTPR